MKYIIFFIAFFFTINGYAWIHLSIIEYNNQEYYIIKDDVIYTINKSQKLKKYLNSQHVTRYKVIDSSLFLVDMITFRGGSGGYLKKDSLGSNVYCIEPDSILVNVSNIHLFVRGKKPVKVKSYSGALIAKCKDFKEKGTNGFRSDILKFNVSKGIVKSIEILNENEYNVRHKSN